MRKFLIRAASGLVYAAVIIAAILYGGWAVWALAIAFSVIGACEVDKMAVGFSRKNIPLFIIDILGVLALFSTAVWKYSILVWIALDIVKIILNRRHVSQNPDKFPYPSFCQIYVAVPLALMVVSPIARLPLLVFILLWLNDSGAYIVGSLTGRHKLCPSISPNKTWEGFIGGVVIAMAGAWIMEEWYGAFFGMASFSLAQWMLIAFSTCIFGTLGDLLESKIKRHYGVKDSGHWIPGHGGILDRIDSFLLAFPVAFFLVLMF